jgi:hypothetical protein
LKNAPSFADKIRNIIKKQEFTDKGGHSLCLAVSTGSLNMQILIVLNLTKAQVEKNS